MRLESLLIGMAITAFGVVLVATHGVVAGVNIPALAGLSSSCSTSGAPGNGTGNPGFCPGFGGYSIGTIVVIFGLGMLANGLRSPAPMRLSKGADGGMGMGMGMMPPELMASMGIAQRQIELASSRMAPQAGGPQVGVRYCSNCGRANAQEAQFCQQCGKPMNLLPAGLPPSAPAPPPPPTSMPPTLPPPPPPPPEAPKA